jgi:hypothetical protein
VRLALLKILVSPEFIFRMEFDPPEAAAGSVHRISDVELASRGVAADGPAWNDRLSGRPQPKSLRLPCVE